MGKYQLLVEPDADGIMPDSMEDLGVMGLTKSLQYYVFSFKRRMYINPYNIMSLVLKDVCT